MADESPGEWEDLGRTCPGKLPPQIAARPQSPSHSDDDSDDESSASDDEEDRRWAASEIVPGVWVGQKEDAELAAGLDANAASSSIAAH